WVALLQILRLEGDCNYTHCFFTDGTQLLVALSLKRLADRLPAGSFIRSHRKHLINRQYIGAVHAIEYAVTLTNGDRIAIARRRMTDFLQTYRQSAC
ncbi:MAG: LytTR family transcriptional regulator, partial [Rudanella sp.]|nr:LytTR family transcriptional regulator [Rudanella sp.]